jgi:hypothetical protein
MPIAGYRGWVGFAKPNGVSYLTAAVTAAGTSLPVATTGNQVTAIPASTTVYIVDGVNSEAVAVSAGGGTATLTVGALAHNHPANTPVFSQLTASLGPANWMPVTNLDYQDHIATIEDKGIRGSNVAIYNITAATAYADLQIDGDLFPDVFGYVVGSIFGAVDFAGGTPNTHTFAAMNTSASNGQPTPLLVFMYNGNNVRLFAGAKASEVVLKFDPTKNLTFTSKWMSLESGVVANYTPTFSALTPQGAWQASTSINSVVVPNTLSADFTIKRDSMDAVQTLDGSQQATIIWAGPLSTSGNLLLTYEDDTNLNLYLNTTQLPLSFDLLNGTGATQVEAKLQMTKCVFMDGWKPTITGGKGYVEIGGPVAAVSNTTDANTAGGGYSPSRFVLKNTVATGTYQ